MKLINVIRSSQNVKIDPINTTHTKQSAFDTLDYYRNTTRGNREDY